MNIKNFIILFSFIIGVEADPRGERGEKIEAGQNLRRVLKEDKDEEDTGDGSGSVNFATNEFGQAFFSFSSTNLCDGSNPVHTLTNGICETHGCQTAGAGTSYVNAFGGELYEANDVACMADPVNGCDGGCCRFGNYWICDTSNFAPPLACVCNSLTAPASSPATPVPVPAPSSATGAPVLMEPEPDTSSTIAGNDTVFEEASDLFWARCGKDKCQPGTSGLWIVSSSRFISSEDFSHTLCTIISLL